MSYIKGLGQKFELLDRRLSEFRPPQPAVEQPSSKITDEQMEEKETEIQTLCQQNFTLEKENKIFNDESSDKKSKSTFKRRQLIFIFWKRVFLRSKRRR